MTKEEAKMSKKGTGRPFCRDRHRLRPAGESPRRQGRRGNPLCRPRPYPAGRQPLRRHRRFATELGAAAGQLILDEHYGFMVALKGDKLEPVPLSEVAGQAEICPGRRGRSQIRQSPRHLVCRLTSKSPLCSCCTGGFSLLKQTKARQTAGL